MRISTRLSAMLAVFAFFSLPSSQILACGYNFVGDCPTAVFFKINGSPDSFYVGGCTFGTQIQGLDFGQLRSLRMTKVTGTSWESCHNNVTAMEMRFRIYQTGSPSGAWQTLDLEEFYQTIEGPYTTRYRRNLPDLNVFNGLSMGQNYTMELFFRMEVDTVGDDFIAETEVFENNAGLNFHITFTPAGPNGPPFAVVPTHLKGVTCASDSTGLAGVTVYGDQNGLFYDWGWPGSNFFTQFNLPAGEYEVLVTGASGYAESETVIIPSESNVSVSITDVSEVSCNGSPGEATAVPTGGQEPYQFNWNNGGSAETGQFFQPDVYWMTVTDAIGCSKETFVEIGGEVSVELDVAASICAGNQYVMGANQFSVAGNYTVLLPGNAGCDTIVHLSLAVQNPGAILSGLVSEVEISCAEPAETVCVDAPANANLFWFENGVPMGSSDCYSIENEGVVSVTAWQNGCSAQSQILVEGHFDLPTGLGIGTAFLDCGTDTLEVALQGFTSTEQPHYQWVAPDGWTSGLQQTTYSTANFLQVDSLKLWVTDAFGCSASVPVQITINKNVAVPDVHLLAVEPTCAATWAGSMAVSGGVPPYVLNWSDPSVSGVNFNLPPGNYTVTVTGLNGCSISSSLILNALDTISVNSVGLPKCDGNTAVSVLVSGGIQPYAYQWSNPNFTGGQADLPPGNYGLTVSDNINCLFVSEINIPAFDTLNFELKSSNASGPNAADGSASVESLTGATAPNYVWSNGQTGANLENLPPGIYCLTVTDFANGCSKTACVEVGWTIGNAEIPDANSLIIRPNPASERIWVELPGRIPSPEKMRVEVFDATGKRAIFLQEQTSNSIDVSNLPSGVYFLKVDFGAGVFVGRFFR